MEWEDPTDPDPALSRALLDAARLGLRYTLEAVLAVPHMRADGRFLPRAFPCRTPLHESAQGGHEACVAFLLARGAKVMAVTPARVAPLHVAASPAVARLLVSALREQRPEIASPLFVCDKNDQTVLHFAARAGLTDVLAALVQEEAEEHVLKALGVFDHWRRTCLHWAVVNEHVDTVRVLLRCGAKARPDNMRIGRPGPGTHLLQETPLQLAVRRRAPQELIDILTRAEEEVQGV
jgi:hypothetical protein